MNNKLIEELYNKIDNQEKIIRELQEENLLLRASEPMSILAEDYGYKARVEKAIEYIEHSINYGILSQTMPHLKLYVNSSDILEILKGVDKENE